MRQGLLIMADDGIIEISNPKGAVGAQLHLHRAKSGVITREKIRHADRLRCRARPIEPVAIDAAGDRIAIEKIAAVFFGKLRGGIIRNASDGARAVIVERDRGSKT